MGIRKVLPGLVFLSFFFQGCYFWEEGGKEPIRVGEDPNGEQHSDSESHTKEMAHQKTEAQLMDEKELKIARLWARVDELEEGQRQFREKLKLLERGLTLGIVPDELKEWSDSHEHKKDSASLEFKKDSSHDKASPIKRDKRPTDSLTAPLSPQEEKAYQDALAVAHEHFRAGRYGRAIVEFDTLGKRWGDRVPGGAYLYWVGKSWIQLKEYQTARKILEEFLNNQSQSPWIPRAKLELARIEWKLGQNETALGKYREIIRDYPYEDAAEMAKMELSQVDKAL